MTVCCHFLSVFLLFALADIVRRMSIKIPTTITDAEVQEFKAIYLKHFNIELSDEEASMRGLKLLRFMGTILDLSGAYFVD